MKTYGGEKNSFTRIRGAILHVPEALPPGKAPPLANGQETRWGVT